MMTIEKQLEYLEKNIKADIDGMTPEKRTNYYQNLKEFVRPKIQRVSFIQDSEMPSKIEIEIVK